jgi:hypothetical protein
MRRRPTFQSLRVTEPVVRSFTDTGMNVFFSMPGWSGEKKVPEGATALVEVDIGRKATVCIVSGKCSRSLSVR